MIYLVVLLTVFFTGCRNEIKEQQLIDHAETLLEINPDSTYLLLVNITMADNLSDKLLARWCMLYGKAADKVVKDMPYVSQLLRARSWYEKHGTPYEQAQIGLFLGRSYVEDREYMKAMDAYTQALDVAERAKEYNVAGYICSYMGDLYDLKGFFQETLDKYNQSADYFLKADNKRSYALALKFIAQTLAFEDSCSLALDYLLKADSIVVCLQDSGAMSSIENGLGNVYGLMGNWDKAEYYLLKSLESNVSDIAPSYSALSELYMSIGNFDKARLYLDKSRIHTKNQFTPISTLYTEYEIEKKSGNMEQALFILERYTEKLDSFYNSTIHLDILDAEKRYNHVLLLNENARLHNNNLIELVIIVIIVCIGLLFGVIVLFHYNKKNKMLYEQEVKLKKNEERISVLSYELEKKKKEIIIQQSIYDNESKLSLLKEDMVNIEKELDLLKEEKMKNATIVKKIIKLSLNVVAGNEKPLLINRDWCSLMDLINQTYHLFEEFVSDNPHGLTLAEIQYCYLSFLKLDISSEAILLNINPESISKRRLRIRQKLGYAGSEVPFFECICKCLSNK